MKIVSFDNFLNESEESESNKPTNKFYNKIEKSFILEDWFIKWGVKNPVEALKELNDLGFKITYKK